MRFRMAVARNRVIATVVATLVAAALLGGSLGIAAAGQHSSPLVAGVNPTVGGPLFGSVTPGKFMSCLPDGSWSSLYWWDATNQTWRHYLNTDGTGVPDYVNDSATGGLTIIPRFDGVAVLMNDRVDQPFFPDRQTDLCP